MRVHIVCHDPQNKERSILARLGHDLAQHAGWSIGGEPDPLAQLNYFFPYITYAERFTGWNKTPTAAWFSHREAATWKQKQALWDRAAASVDLRLTTARQFLPHLEPHGPTMLVERPAVDQERFSLGERQVNDRPVIGLSGFVDVRSGRKGERVVMQLAKAGLPCQFRAIGQGWPVPTRLVNWDQVPAFYRSIDLYLCTSWLEGVPMPPLEALACGTPVIIPRGVGLLDNLPATAGIWRYKARCYDSLLGTVREALQAGAPDRATLRAAVAEYTAANWAADHVAAFESFLYPAESGNLPHWEDASGMYCVAFGEPSRACAVTCIDSFKKHNPSVPVAFCGTEPLDAGEDHFIQRPDADIGGRLAKLAIYDAAPADWRYVLYLDADTETVEPLDAIFRFLADGWEAVICTDMAKYHVARMMLRPDNQAETRATLDLLGCDQVMQYNGGVFAFRRCENVRRLFELWNQEWQRYGARDQGALLRALHQNPVRLFVLGNQWNASDRYPWPVGDVAVIHHNQQARRWGGLIDGRLDSPAAWQRVKQWEAARR